MSVGSRRRTFYAYQMAMSDRSRRDLGLDLWLQKQICDSKPVWTRWLRKEEIVFQKTADQKKKKKKNGSKAPPPPSSHIQVRIEAATGGNAWQPSIRSEHEGSR